MRFIEEFGYCVQPGMEEEHQAWLEANEPGIRDSCPDGVGYLGTFITVYSSEKGAGFYRTLFELDSYGAQDRMAAASKEADSTFGKLQREASRFDALDWSAPSSHGLYKAVVDATIFDRPST